MWSDPSPAKRGNPFANPGAEEVAAATSSPLHITYLLPNLDIGGGQRVAMEHVNLLHRRGHDAALFGLNKQPTWFPLEAPFRVFAGKEELVQELSLRPGMKVATWWETAPLVLAACKPRGIPVYFVQDIESSYFIGDPITQTSVIQTYSADFHYLTTSPWLAQWLEKALGHRAAVVSPAIDHAVFHPRDLPRAKDLICAIHRPEPLKNFELTRFAFRQLRVPARMISFGHYSINEPGVTFLPSPSDEQVAEIYNAATLFIQTSIHEGFCLPVLEAMACGCPVVTTDADGNMAFCKDGENCLIVPQHDAALVARVVERLLADTALQERLRQGGLKTAREFTWEEAGDKLEAFYRSVAASAQKEAK